MAFILQDVFDTTRRNHANNLVVYKGRLPSENVSITLYCSVVALNNNNDLSAWPRGECIEAIWGILFVSL